eukprot:1479910-Rhodomonas_salina.3
METEGYMASKVAAERSRATTRITWCAMWSSCGGGCCASTATEMLAGSGHVPCAAAAAAPATARSGPPRPQPRRGTAAATPRSAPRSTPPRGPRRCAARRLRVRPRCGSLLRASATVAGPEGARRTTTARCSRLTSRARP